MSPSDQRDIGALEQVVASTEKAVTARKDRPLPSEANVETAVANMREILFPGTVGRLQESEDPTDVRTLINETQELLHRMLTRAFKDDKHPSIRALDTANSLLQELTVLRETLLRDAEAALVGDPAALDTDNVILNYPGFRAIVVQRIAHLLHLQKTPLVPRQMTELAHRQTGIDIHPGAAIGEGFFIDHGTGVVIGETAEIGKNVRLYQGVTLGASTDPVKAGRTKRHPTLEDGVICFANSGVFGPVTIGDHSIIGAGAEVFDDVAARTVVQAPVTDLRIRERKKPQS